MPSQLTPRLDLRHAVTPMSTTSRTPWSILERVLRSELGSVGFAQAESDEVSTRSIRIGWFSSSLGGFLLRPVRRANSSSVTSDSPRNERRDPAPYRCTSFSDVTEHRLFSGFFMALTVYALFVPDLDLCLGDKASRQSIGILTTCILGCFLLELFCLSCAESRYVFRAYFWLDLIAALSLLPDTILMQPLFMDTPLGMSSSISALYKSTRATRLYRFTRLVRIAALMPRLVFFFFPQTTETEIDTLLDKKLSRIFACLDEDLDGVITRDELQRCISMMNGGLGEYSPESPAAKRSITDTISPCKTGSEQTLDGSMVYFADFRRAVLEDEQLRRGLRRDCRRILKQDSGSMRSLASKQSEAVGMRVVMGVLLMLLVLSLVEPVYKDNSAVLGLEHLDTQVRERYQGDRNGTIPLAVREHVEVWMRLLSQLDDEESTLVYLDVDSGVYCNEFVPTGQRCALAPDAAMSWTRRASLEDIDRDRHASDFRDTDLSILRLPATSGEQAFIGNLGNVDEEINTIAVFNTRLNVQAEARMSIVATCVIMAIIVASMLLLTRDLTYLSVSLLKPLQVLADDMKKISQFDVSYTTDSITKLWGPAEIRVIQGIFEKIKNGIKSWGKYVPWPVVKILLNSGQDATLLVAERDVTIFFSDIESFTTIVESNLPQDTLHLLSRYFDKMSNIIDDHNGVVIEFLGDAILSVYGAPLSNPEHAAAGVMSTLQMLKALDKLNEWSQKHGLPAVKIRCGIHTGKVLVGNIGFHSRIKYGVVGENANVPGRLEELNKEYGTDNLVSASTYSRLDLEVFVARPIDYVHLKPGTATTSELVYQILGTKEKADEHRLGPTASLHAKAVESYRARKFKHAAPLFNEVNERMRELTGEEVDKASAVMQNRCLVYQQHPPPDNWDGVWDPALQP